MKVAKETRRGISPAGALIYFRTTNKPPVFAVHTARLIISHNGSPNDITIKENIRELENNHN